MYLIYKTIYRYYVTHKNVYKFKKETIYRFNVTRQNVCNHIHITNRCINIDISNVTHQHVYKDKVETMYRYNANQ